jgi:hypothetical protein
MSGGDRPGRLTFFVLIRLRSTNENLIRENPYNPWRIVVSNLQRFFLRECLLFLRVAVLHSPPTVACAAGRGNRRGEILLRLS